MVLGHSITDTGLGLRGQRWAKENPPEIFELKIGKEEGLIQRKGLYVGVISLEVPVVPFLFGLYMKGIK